MRSRAGDPRCVARAPAAPRRPCWRACSTAGLPRWSRPPGPGERALRDRAGRRARCSASAPRRRCGCRNCRVTPVLPAGPVRSGPGPRPLVDRRLAGRPVVAAAPPTRPHARAARMPLDPVDPVDPRRPGPGLTPAGDDVLAGALVAGHAPSATPRCRRLAIRHARRRCAARRTTAVSRGLLHHALDGWATPELAAYVDEACAGTAGTRAGPAARGRAHVRATRWPTGVAARPRARPSSPRSRMRTVELRRGRLRRLGDADAGQPARRRAGRRRRPRWSRWPPSSTSSSPRGWASTCPRHRRPTRCSSPSRPRPTRPRRRAGRGRRGARRGLAPGARPGSATPRPPPTVRAAAAPRSEATVALISTPGQYAFADALDAVDAGLLTMVFSDNVPVEQEVALKEYAGRGRRARDGTRLRHGGRRRRRAWGSPTSCARARSASSRRPGTGAQHLMALLDGAGVGVSHCLGRRRPGPVRDGRRAGRRCAPSTCSTPTPATSLIVVVSKPPGRRGRRARCARTPRRSSTPVLFGLLGAGQPDLTATAAAVVEAAGGTWTAPEHWTGCGAGRGATGRPPARAVRRRHAVRRGDAASPSARARPGRVEHPPRPRLGARRRPRAPTATRWSTSATTG